MANDPNFLLLDFPQQCDADNSTTPLLKEGLDSLVLNPALNSYDSESSDEHFLNILEANPDSFIPKLPPS